MRPPSAVERQAAVRAERASRLPRPTAWARVQGRPEGLRGGLAAPGPGTHQARGPPALRPPPRALDRWKAREGLLSPWPLLPLALPQPDSQDRQIHEHVAPADPAAGNRLCEREMLLPTSSHSNKLI